MGEKKTADLRLGFDRRVRLQFHGAKVSSDAGLLAVRELAEALGLTELAESMLMDTRRDHNVHHSQVRLFRQAVYSRLAGYEDTNDAECLALDPVMRTVVGQEARGNWPPAPTPSVGLRPAY